MIIIKSWSQTIKKFLISNVNFLIKFLLSDLISLRILTLIRKSTLIWFLQICAKIELLHYQVLSKFYPDSWWRAQGARKLVFCIMHRSDKKNWNFFLNNEPRRIIYVSWMYCTVIWMRVWDFYSSSICKIQFHRCFGVSSTELHVRFRP